MKYSLSVTAFPLPDHDNFPASPVAAQGATLTCFCLLALHYFYTVMMSSSLPFLHCELRSRLRPLGLFTPSYTSVLLNKSA